MTEEKKEDGNDELVPKKDLDALRAKLEGRLADANKSRQELEGRLASVESKIVGSQFDVQIPEQDEEGKGIDAETKAKLEVVLKRAKENEQNLVTTVQYALQQRAELLALQTAVEVNALDDKDQILEKIRQAPTPKDMETVAKEIRLEYKEAAIESKTKAGDNSEDDTVNPDRKFAEGKGKGTNKRSNLEKQIQDIDPSDPEAEKKLNALYEEVVALSR